MASRGSDVAPFLRKAYQMVDDEETKDIISWTGDGKQFTIHKLNEFSSQLLPKYFKHSNFSSFVRQLNSYGFRKVEPARWTFATEGFSKNNEEDLSNIRRRQVSKKGQKEPSTNPPETWEGGQVQREGEGYGGQGQESERRAPSALFETNVRQELQIYKLELSHVVHRLSTVEHIQEQLLSLLSSPQVSKQPGVPSSINKSPSVNDVLQSLHKQIRENRHATEATYSGWAFGGGALPQAAFAGEAGAHPGLPGAHLSLRPSHPSLGYLPGAGVATGMLPKTRAACRLGFFGACTPPSQKCQAYVRVSSKCEKGLGFYSGISFKQGVEILGDRYHELKAP